MDRRIQKTLDAGERALLFTREHPGSEPGIKTLEGELGQVVGRAVGLARLQIDADERRADRTAWRQVARRNLRRLLRAVAKVGKAASAERPELGPVFGSVPGTPAYRRLRPAAEVILKAAREQEALLGKYGLDPALLQDAENALASLIKAGDDAELRRQERVGAVAELRKAARQVTSVIERLDARNRYRWAAAPELLSAWVAASRVERESGPAVTPGPEGTSPPPAGGSEVKSA